MTRWVVLALAGLVLGLVPGCSFLFASGPPAGHEKLRYFDCTSDMGAPAGDASWAVGEGLLVAAALSAGDTRTTPDDSEDESRGSAAGAAAVFGIAAGVHVASFIYGLVQTGHCSDAKQHLAQRIADRERDSDQTIETLHKQLAAQQAAGAPVGSSTPSTLELVPTPESAPAQPAAAPAPTAVPPPPPGYTEPASAPAKP